MFHLSLLRNVMLATAISEIKKSQETKNDSEQKETKDETTAPSKASSFSSRSI